MQIFVGGIKTEAVHVTVDVLDVYRELKRKVLAQWGLHESEYTLKTAEGVDWVCTDEDYHHGSPGTQRLRRASPQEVAILATLRAFGALVDGLDSP